MMLQNRKMVVKVPSEKNCNKIQPKQTEILRKCLLIVKWRAGFLLLCSFIIFLGFMKMYASSVLLSVKEEEHLKTNAVSSISLSSTTQNGISYNIMIDAGSTGSRIHIYKFSYNAGLPKLLNEVFKQVHPGLSSYANNPSDGAASIENLLKIAMKEIPKQSWSKTKLALRATAGLRLLPEKQADMLLNEVESLFKKYSFRLPPNPVAVMEGLDEGKFGWISVNYLLDRLGPAGSQFTVGTIDLGGGSMQITFAPNEMDTISKSPAEFITKSSVFGSDLKLYSHSYLGLGLMSAREAVLKHARRENSIAMTACLPRNYETKWKNGQNNYELKGIGDSVSYYNVCRQISQKAVVRNFHQLPEIKHRTFYVFSYFFDRAVETKLVDANTGGTLTVQDYIDAAVKVCSAKQFDEKNPFLCMDMVLLATFLEDGYGFDKTMKLTTTNTIDGKETSWTLGASFSLLQ